MRIFPIAAVIVLVTSSAFAQGPSPFNMTKTSTPTSATIAMEPARSTLAEAGYGELMQQIVRRADPLDEADIRQMERRAQGGSRDDQLVMGCLLSLGSAAQVTSPQVPNLDPAKATHYFEMAARNGSPEAQLLLGVMDLHGMGSAIDRVSGAMWIQIASTAKLKPATREARNLSHELSRDELAQAQRRAQEWLAQRARDLAPSGPVQ